MVINPLLNVYSIYITFHAFFRVTNVLASSLQLKVRQRTLWLTSGSWFGSKTVEQLSCLPTWGKTTRQAIYLYSFASD